MKKAKKILLLVLCAALLVSASVMGTLAYLTSTAKVTNTFTVGSVNITMDEAKVNPYGAPVKKNAEDQYEICDLAEAERGNENQYKLIPGHTYVKDPTIHVVAGSEECYLFVKIVNNIDALEAETTIAQQMTINGWTYYTGKDVWYKAAPVDARATAQDVVIFEQFTIAKTVTSTNLKQINNATVIEVTAYAIQADGFASAQAAWDAAGSNFQ